MSGGDTRPASDRTGKGDRHVRTPKHRTAPGSPPGTLAPDPAAPPPVIEVLTYGPEDAQASEKNDIGAIRELVGKQPVTWIRVMGLGDLDQIKAIAEAFGIDRLALADVVNARQRPKAEHFEQHLFIVGRIAHLARPRLRMEQFSMFLGSDYLLTFEERESDWPNPVRQRVLQSAGGFRERGPDYLAYALLDTLVDQHFPILEEYGEQLDELEDLIITKPGREALSRIHEVKRELLTLRRSLWPLREVVNALIRDTSKFVQHGTLAYLRDTYDHVIQVIDMTQNLREIGADLTDVYLSSVSNRMNEVMKVLTVIATIFIPLTFFAGIWGMNFRHMPELGWRFGYLFAWGMMAVVAIVMLIYFKRRGWLSRDR